ncbi:TonB-dependent receptor [Alteromonas pelagimontana]|uniref:TonB-dependent receptor n=1 Tax=Alteromonas pelagimontana TaxID=1858656 RepID=A0A6M4MD39_9ALTE|nr:TonB-dependent receptor [Alteromonas pelagimontana]QJR81104.1 TonB-dependent receptor [Alteromonas pelagimontana]
MNTNSAWMKKRALAVAVASAGIATFPALAQMEGATLRGKIQSESAATQGVEVLARDTERGYVSETTSRKNGSFIFVGLKPGTYQVIVNGEVQEVTLRVGQSAKVNFSLDEVGAENVERITVSGSRMASFSGNEIGTNITPEMMERLPQNNRNFLAFADLAPGVQVNTGEDGSVSLRGGAQHQRNVNVFLDGVSQKDYVLKGGVTGQDSSRGNPFPQSAIGEYKVITQNYKAEYDQVGSTAITAVTRSGTNEFEGEVFFDYTDEGLREPEPNESEGKVRSMIRHSGVTLSGPILKDRLHFIAAFERKTINQPYDVVGGNGVDFVTLPEEYAAEIGRFTSNFEEDLFFGKVDWAINENQTMEFSAKIRDESDVSGFGGANAFSYGSNRQLQDNRYHLKHTYTANAWQNEFRITYEDSSWSPRATNLEIGRKLETAARQEIINIGGGGDYQEKGQKGWGVQNDFTWLDLEWHGYHVIKAGVKYKDIELSSIQQQPYNPQYYYNVQFNGEDTFGLVQPYRVSWGVPATDSVGGTVVADNRQLGLYIQDDWEVTDRLTLNIGVRWDYEETPSYKNYQTPEDLVAALQTWPNIENANYDIDDYISTGEERDYFTGAWQPRVGFSYIVDDDENHMVFGGYGRSYDRNQFDFVQLEQSAGSFTAATYLFQGDPDNPCNSADSNCIAWDPQYLTQAGLDGLVSDIEVKGERFLLNNDLKMPYSDQFSLGIRSIWGDWNTEISIARIESKNGFNWLLGNRREDGSFFEPGTNWGPPWASGVPGWGNLLLASNDGETRSNNVYFTLNRSHKEGWGMNLAYTFSDAKEYRVFSDAFALDYENLEDYGWKDSVGVPEHRVVVTGSYDLPWQISLTAKYTWSSRTFYEYTNCVNSNDCTYQRVKPGESDYQRFDLALSKDFTTNFITADSALWVRLDVQNLFNTSNYSNFYLNPELAEHEQPNYNSATNGGKRQLKLSVGWQF